MGSYDLKSVKVLIVEDSSFMAQLLVVMLKAFNVREIRQAYTESKFIEEFHSFRPDLILTDWEVPGFGGDKVAQIVRTQGKQGFQFTPIIAVSGHTEIERIKEMLLHGIDDVIVKPVSSEDLYGRIGRLISDPPDYVANDKYLGPERNLKHLGINPVKQETAWM